MLKRRSTLSRVEQDALTAAQIDPQLRTDWAARCKRAHANAVENLVLFAPLVIALQLAGIGTALTLLGAI